MSDPIVAIAKDTSIRKVGFFRKSTMFVADDVVHLTSENGIFRVDEAVLTQMFRSRNYESSQMGIDVISHRLNSGGRVLSLDA